MKARQAQKLQSLHRSAAAAADRQRRESDIAAQREREEIERAEAKAKAANVAANLENRRTQLNERMRTAAATGSAKAAAAAREQLRKEYLRSSSGKEGKNPYGLPLRPKSEPEFKQPPQPRGSAGAVIHTQYPKGPPKKGRIYTEHHE